MPGIVGLITQRPAEEARRLAQLMVQSMCHESFYRSDVASFPELGLHAGWTALEGTFAAEQMFGNEDQSISLLMAGECFPDAGEVNRLETRQPVGSWLIARYEAQGERFVESLNGLFSGLLIDRRQRKVILLNDRYGAERLYVHERDGETYFASEAKAILRVVPETRAFDDQGVAEFLSFGCTLGERSLFRGLRVLPGASQWTFEQGRCRKGIYFSPETWEQQERLAPDQCVDQFQSIFERVVPRQLLPSRRIGISLTAGLDSRMILAARPASADRVVAFTYSGEEVDPLDARISARIAQACGFDHHILRIGPDFFRDFASLAERTVYLTDGCFGPTGSHEIYMSRLARHLAPVRLTGNYGGEILRGVSNFKPQVPQTGLIAADFLPEVHRACESLCEYRREHPVTFAAFRETPWSLYGNLQAGRSQIGFRTPYLDNDFVRLAYQRPKSEHEAQAVCESLIRRGHPALAAFPTDMGLLGCQSGVRPTLRRLGAKVAFKLDYYSSAGLPSRLASFDPLFQSVMKQLGLQGLHKHLRYATWFRGRLTGWLRERLAEAAHAPSPYWDRNCISRMADDHIAGRKNLLNEISAVLTLQMVERKLLSGDKPPVLAHVIEITK
jgi:asparagine synthase (glutamine-hydrolysing)